MITEKRRRGDMGEDFAAEYLEKQGYEIIERNFNTRLGEIDIVAKDGRYIVFVEVKSRADDCLYAPREAVTRSKQQKICKAAMLYRIKKGLNGQP
ncbi:MAG: YraN family protein, partial [Oscillospiraceae bacterium]|nr:YraN family protein [Oscillospiraceae bacterium]